MATDNAALGQELARQHAANETYASLKLTGLDQAYAVQREYVRALRARDGITPVGYKIGLTTKRMQAMCGIDHPIGGVVLSNRVHASGATLPAANYGRIGLEFEIGVKLGRDLPPTDAPYDMHKITNAITAICPAVEVVDDRRADYKTLEVASLVADNSWNAGIVLGEFRSTWPELTSIPGTVRLNGAEVDRGVGSDVLGHPFEPLIWLANQMARNGEGMRAGDIILTGSLVTTRFPATTERYAWTLEGLGTVEVTVTV